MVQGEYSARVRPCFYIPRYMDGEKEGEKLVDTIKALPYFTNVRYRLGKLDAADLPSTLIPTNNVDYDPCIINGRILDDPCCKDGPETCGYSSDVNRKCITMKMCMPNQITLQD